MLSEQLTTLASLYILPLYEIKLGGLHIFIYRISFIQTLT